MVRERGSFNLQALVEKNQYVYLGSTYMRLLVDISRSLKTFVETDENVRKINENVNSIRFVCYAAQVSNRNFRMGLQERSRVGETLLDLLDELSLLLIGSKIIKRPNLIWVYTTIRNGRRRLEIVGSWQWNR